MKNATVIAESLPRQRGGPGLTLADAFTCLYVTTSPNVSPSVVPDTEDYGLKGSINMKITAKGFRLAPVRWFHKAAEGRAICLKTGNL